MADTARLAVKLCQRMPCSVPHRLDAHAHEAMPVRALRGSWLSLMRSVSSTQNAAASVLLTI